MRLSPDQIEAFHRDGYVVSRQVLTDTDLNPLIEDFNALIETVAKRLFDEGAIRNTHADDPFDRRIASLTAEAGKSLQSQVSFPVNLRPRMFDFLHTPNLLDAVESLVGLEIYCNPTHHVRPKLPEAIGASDWIQRSPVHQDAAVLLPEADETLIVTTWIPLVDATEKNGTLQVYPRLHTGPIRTHEKCPYGWTITDAEMPTDTPLTIPVNRGDVIFIHCRTPHSSTLNRSDRVRWSLDLRWHDARKPAGRPFPGLLVRSREKPLTAYDAWVKAWAEVQADTRPRTLYRWPLS